jgi:hypothetical protein
MFLHRPKRLKLDTIKEKSLKLILSLKLFKDKEIVLILFKYPNRIQLKVLLILELIEIWELICDRVIPDTRFPKLKVRLANSKEGLL